MPEKRPTPPRRAEAAYAQVAHLRAVRSADPELLRRLSAGAERLDEALLAAVAVAARLEQPLRERAEAGSERAAELAGELARVGGLEHEARRQSARANERAAAAELERARLGGEGQIRMLQVDETEREQIEREARDLTEEAERLALAAADAAEAARTATVARSDNGGRARALDADLLLRVSRRRRAARRDARRCHSGG